MQTISWRDPKVVKTRGKIEIFEFARGSLRDIGRESFGVSFQKEITSALVCKRFDHAGM
jgi:hypothetical protein